MFETTIELLKGRLEVGQSVRVRFNPAHHSKVVLLNAASAGGLWHVATHCPGCGAPVDIGHGVGGRPSGLRVLPSVDPV